MIRYGIKTWKRIALPAVLFLGLAVFLGVSAWQIHHSVHKEMVAYGKIMCTLDDTTDSEMAQALFLQYDGSCVYDLQVILQNSHVQKEYSVTGIEAEMIPGTLTEGRYYTDDSSMPAIVINQAALAELAGTDDKSDSKTVSLVGHTLIMGSSSAKICGIVVDTSETPAVYISIPAAKAYMQQQETAGDGAEENSVTDTVKPGRYWIRISNLHALLKVQEQMNSLGIVTSVDENQVMQWREQSIRQTYDILMGLLAMAGYVSCLVLSILRSKYQEGPQPPQVCAARIGMSTAVGMGIGIVANYLAGLWT